MESVTRAMALLVVATALTSTVSGMPSGILKKHHCAHGHGRKSQTVLSDPNALQSAHNFGGGYDFGQQFDQQFVQQFAPQFGQQFAPQFGQQFAAPQFGQQFAAPQFGQQFGQQFGGQQFGPQFDQAAYRTAKPVTGYLPGALPDNQSQDVPQSRAFAQGPAQAQNKEPPSSNKLETTTENRTFIGAPAKDCKEGQVKNQDRECVDAKSAPED